MKRIDKPKKMSYKYWHAKTAKRRESKFGFVVLHKNRWHGFIKYYFSETPDDINTFKEFMVCIAKCRTLKEAQRMVENKVYIWIKKLIAEPDERIVILYPRKKLFLPFAQRLAKNDKDMSAILGPAKTRKPAEAPMLSIISPENVSVTEPDHICHGTHEPAETCPLC